jgi:RNA polymerase sigma-70 factor (ECF subfamily)
LLVRIRDLEDQEAWKQFVELYTPLIYGYCRGRGLQDGDAADVSQEVMRTVMRALEKFEYDPQRGRFRNWLFTVVRSKLNNFLAAQHRLPVAADSTLLQRLNHQPAPPDEDQWDRDYRQRLFDWAATKVRTEVQETTWQAFWRTAMENQRSDEVASRLGLNLASVYAARSRVTTRLKTLIAEADGDDSAFAEMTL